MRRPQIAYRRLDVAGLDRIGEIDRTGALEVGEPTVTLLKDR